MLYLAICSIIVIVITIVPIFMIANKNKRR